MQQSLGSAPRPDDRLRTANDHALRPPSAVSGAALRRGAQPHGASVALAAHAGKREKSRSRQLGARHPDGRGGRLRARPPSQRCGRCSCTSRGHLRPSTRQRDEPGSRDFCDFEQEQVSAYLSRDGSPRTRQGSESGAGSILDTWPSRAALGAAVVDRNCAAAAGGSGERPSPAGSTSCRPATFVARSCYVGRHQRKVSRTVR